MTDLSFSHTNPESEYDRLCDANAIYLRENYHEILTKAGAPKSFNLQGMGEPLIHPRESSHEPSFDLKECFEKYSQFLKEGVFGNYFKALQTVYQQSLPGGGSEFYFRIFESLPALEKSIEESGAGHFGQAILDFQYARMVYLQKQLAKGEFNGAPFAHYVHALDVYRQAKERECSVSVRRATYLSALMALNLYQSDDHSFHEVYKLLEEIPRFYSPLRGVTAEILENYFLRELLLVDKLGKDWTSLTRAPEEKSNTIEEILLEAEKITVFEVKEKGPLAVAVEGEKLKESWSDPFRALSEVITDRMPHNVLIMAPYILSHNLNGEFVFDFTPLCSALGAEQCLSYQRITYDLSPLNKYLRSYYGMVGRELEYDEIESACRDFFQCGIERGEKLLTVLGIDLNHYQEQITQYGLSESTAKDAEIMFQSVQSLAEACYRTLSGAQKKLWQNSTVFSFTFRPDDFRKAFTSELSRGESERKLFFSSMTVDLPFCHDIFSCECASWYLRATKDLSESLMDRMHRLAIQCATNEPNFGEEATYYGLRPKEILRELTEEPEFKEENFLADVDANFTADFMIIGPRESDDDDPLDDAGELVGPRGDCSAL